MDKTFILPTPGKEKRLGQLPGCSLNLTIASLWKQFGGLWIIVVPDSNMAANAERELSFFLKSAQIHCPILTFPDWETLPYDSFSPHQDIVSERLTTLYHLPHLKQGIMIVPVATFMTRLVSG